MTRFGVPGQNIDTLSYADGRLATVPAIQAPRRPVVTDKKYPIWCEWRVNKDAVAPAIEGECYKLVRFESNGDATWSKCGSGTSGPALSVETDDGAPNVVPDGGGAVQILGGAGIDVTGQGPGNTVTVALAGGGVAVDQIDVDFATGPGVDPVVPTAAGQISVFGNTVVNATNLNSPVATHSRAVNQYHVEVQLATAVAATPADPFDVGLASFDTSSFTVDSNGFTKIKTPYGPVQGYTNLGCAYDGGTGVFSITSADGTALSATNPAYVTFQSKATPGELVTLPVTANQSFIDDVGASEIIDNLFGLTTSIAWANAMPFFIYAVINDDADTVIFGISRSHIMTTSPAASAIGTPAAADADVQAGLFLFSSVTVANYNNNPVVLVGSIRMVMSASDDWTVQALQVYDGIGQFQIQRTFNVPKNQFGAASGTYFSSSTGGDTLPTFPANAMQYYMNLDGMVTVIWNCTSCTASGIGTGNLRLHVPFVPLLSNIQYGPGNMTWIVNSSGNFNSYLSTRNNASSITYFEFAKSGGGLLTPADFVINDTSFAATIQYRAFQQQV